MFQNSFKFVGLLSLGLALTGCSSPGYVPVEELHPQFSMNKRNGQIYIVRPGDTLYAIAFLFDKNVEQLAAHNRISYPYALRVGQSINLAVGARGPISHMPISRIQQTIKHYVPHATSGHWLWPTQGQILRSNLTPVQAKGMNILGHADQAIRASKAGVVAYAGGGLPGYGQLILIKHSNDYLSAYAFNAKLLVKEGQTVTVGQHIANMGQLNPGVYGLHFEIRYRGEAVRPESYLR